VIAFDLNGSWTAVTSDPTTSLLDVLRDELDDRTPKPGCREGRCGACAVLLDGAPVASCMVMVGRVAGHRISTVEGLADADGLLHPVQSAFEDSGAIQCGVCTPGMLMTVVAMWQEDRTWTRAEIQRALVNNLCRCTGYIKILDAVEALLAARGDDG
jgi:aerobic-type carbon monoxide dehydrogenase small subunit (CoxS/CutS family)